MMNLKHLVIPILGLMTTILFLAGKENVKSNIKSSVDTLDVDKNIRIVINRYESGLVKSMLVYNSLPLNVPRISQNYYLEQDTTMKHKPVMFYDTIKSNYLLNTYLYSERGCLIQSCQEYNKSELGPELKWFENGNLQSVTNRVIMDDSNRCTRVKPQIINRHLKIWKKAEMFNDGRCLLFDSLGNLKSSVLYCYDDPVVCF